MDSLSKGSMARVGNPALCPVVLHRAFLLPRDGGNGWSQLERADVDGGGHRGAGRHLPLSQSPPRSHVRLRSVSVWSSWTSVRAKPARGSYAIRGPSQGRSARRRLRGGPDPAHTPGATAFLSEARGIASCSPARRSTDATARGVLGAHSTIGTATSRVESIRESTSTCWCPGRHRWRCLLRVTDGTDADAVSTRSSSVFGAARTMMGAFGVRTREQRCRRGVVGVLSQ